MNAFLLFRLILMVNSAVPDSEEVYNKSTIVRKSDFPVWARLGTFGHKKARNGTFGNVWARFPQLPE
jgi:hypothetical protein